jgi:SAM-dependent methyltransferase/glycosyltransferase involved in cell wall biosynthesis/archaellum component FlaC
MLQNTGERLLPWELQHPQNHYEHLQRYYFAAQFAAGCKVLDLGSGEGYGADILAVAAKEVVGVDISPEVVEWANQRYRRTNLSYLCGSAADIPIQGESMLDLVVCFEMIEHIADQQALLREAKRLLKPEGLLIVSTPNKSVYSDEPQYQNPFHMRELYIPDFRRLIESFFPYASYMGQRVHSAAAMWPLDESATKTCEIVVERRKDTFVPVEAGEKSPMYVVAVASQKPLPVEVQKKNSSYFFLLDVSDTLVKELYKDAQRNLEAQRSSFENRWVEAQSQFVEARSQFDGQWREAKKQEEALRAQIADRDVEIRNAGDRANQLEAQVSKLERRIDELSSRAENLKGELDGVYNSRAWKIAAGLRKAKRACNSVYSAVRLMPLALYRQRSPKPIVALKFVRMLSQSGLVDRDFYRRSYPDVAALGVDPVVHYLMMGAEEGRDPNPFFSTFFYRESNPDVVRAGINPLLHFLDCGGREGRDPHPGFSASFYLEHNPDVARAGLNPLVHFARWGRAEGRKTARHFGGAPESASCVSEHHVPVEIAAYSPLTHPLFDRAESLVLSSDSPSVLIVDYAIPTPDRDSGSLRAFAIVRLLRQMGFHVCFASDRPEPRELYQQRLAGLGVRVLQGFGDIASHLESEGHRYQFVMLSRPDIARRYLMYVRAHALNAIVVYDTVDLHWLRLAREAEIAGDTQVLQQSNAMRRLERLAFGCSDIVVAITEQERRKILEDDPTVCVEVIPNIHNCIDMPEPYSSRKDLMFIGGFYHTPNVDAVTHFVKDIFPFIRASLPGVVFHVIGSDMPASLHKLEAVDVHLVGYVPDPTAFFETCRVFVAPLRFGAGMKGKINQSMSYGLPVVTSQIGAEGMDLRPGDDILVSTTPRDFASNVVRLYHDEQLWNRLSANSRAYVKQNLSEPVVLSRLRKIFDSSQTQLKELA